MFIPSHTPFETTHILKTKLSVNIRFTLRTHTTTEGNNPGGVFNSYYFSLNIHLFTVLKHAETCAPGI